ncbi:LGFP repeat-containing protein [Nocardia lijiangensis]|uniref:LGFP repeat-containing protein n=1 Tax=Nocardia lijiangensis TaxID=299618 RepID=UPI003D757C8D
MARQHRTSSPSARRGAIATAALAIALTAGIGAATARPVGAFDVGGAIEVEYDRAGGPAVLGDPVTPELDAGRGGRFQAFERNAAVYWHPEVDAHSVGGSIRNKWDSLGSENGVLGYPVTGEFATPGRPGRFNHFQGGSIYWSLGTDSHRIGGAIRDKWGAYGWEGGALGFPLTDEATAAKDNGRYNLFEGGAVYWSARTGAHAVWGAIRDDWVRAGGENGRYGYPTGDEYDYQGGKAQDFQGGRITWTP